MVLQLSQFGKIIKQGDRHRREIDFFVFFRERKREREEERKKKEKKKKKLVFLFFLYPYLAQMTPAIEQ